jgi:phosphoesterase RecJ-like protein
MRKDSRQLKRLIDRANNIKIVSHNGPDMDAFCSMLITKEIINMYWPNKSVRVVSKKSSHFRIPNMKDVKVVKKYKREDEDLIIITDVGNWSLILNDEDDKDITEVPYVVIDHHQTIMNEKEELIINDHLSSATEQILETFSDIIGKNFDITEDIAHLAQYGIIADTGRFMYDTTQANTIRIFAELFDFSPVNIEEIEYKSNKFPQESIEIITSILDTLQIDEDMSYAYLDAKTIEDYNWGHYEVNQAFRFVKNNILRYIHGTHWGFLVKPHIGEENTWQVSFRSSVGYQEVDKLAESLGGGGHLHSAGAILEFDNEKTAEEVVEYVLDKISSQTS